jgi:hypothetical protein
MSSTYSINPGTTTEAFKLANIDAVLNELPDNTQKLINPHDLRDAVYTSWENIVIKPTSVSGIEYIGLDRTDLYEKIFLGKKQVSNNNVLNTNLLNTDVDIFLYNTKTDVDLTNQNLKIGFLAGASNSLFYGTTLSIPTIEVKKISTYYGDVLDFNINNNSTVVYGLTTFGGNISIRSTKGNILLNDVIFPTTADITSITDGKVLTFKTIGSNKYATWQTPTITSINTSSAFDITANPLTINGKNYNFSNPIPTAIAIGGVATGSNLSGLAVVDILNKMFYPYVNPSVSITSIQPYYEISSITMSVINLNYIINKYSNSYTVSSINSIPSIISAASASAAITYLNSSAYSIYNGSGKYSGIFNSPKIQTFTLSISDSFGSSYSSNCSVEFIYPIFYGTSITASATASDINNLLTSFNKILSKNPNQTIGFNGNGVCLYYLVPSSYDPTGSMSAFYATQSLFNEKSVFRGNGTPFTMSLASTNWSGVVYNCYVYSPLGYPSITTVGTPTTYAAQYVCTF